jgi:hypothetical protein
MATSETSGRVTLAVVLLAVGTSWNAGNIGPVTSTLSDDFSVSLTAVGLLSGTVFFAGIRFSTILACSRTPASTGGSPSWFRLSPA